MANFLLSLGIQRNHVLGPLILLLFLSVILGIALVGPNYYLLLAVVAIVIGVQLMKSKMLPIILILLIIPFADWAIEYGFLPFQIMWLPELLAGLLFLKSLIQKATEGQKYHAPGLWLAFFFLLGTAVSLMINSSEIVPTLLMLRLLFRYYLLFLAIINLGLEERSIKLIKSIFIFIFVIQLPLSLVKLFIFGQGESPLGLSSHSASTIVPLIAISFLFSYYFLYRKKAIYLVGILCFVAFSVVGGKRAFVFFFITLIAFLTWLLAKQIKLSSRALFLGVLLVCLSFYFAARLLPTLNPQRRIWGDFDFKHIINYAIQYETNVSETGLTTGRISTTLNVFDNLNKGGLSRAIFGFGPGAIIKSMFGGYDRRESLEKKFGIGYGVNGTSWLAIQVGYLGILAYFLFLVLFFRISYLLFRREKDQYWRSFASGMVGFSFILILTSMVYSPFFYFDAISAFYFCLMSIVILRMKNSESLEKSIRTSQTDV